MTDSMSEKETEKKRKRHDENNPRPRKKAATLPTGDVKVEWVPNKAELGPLLGTRL